MSSAAEISLFSNPRARAVRVKTSDTSPYTFEAAKSVRHFHKSMPGYSPTPLVSLDDLASKLGIARVWVKDESQRFDLNAFKILGASYAFAMIFADVLGLDKATLTFPALVEHAERLENETIITATDGNHGRAVAWMARATGCEAVVYMPEGTSQERFDAIAALGADASIIDGTYDDAVALATRHAADNGWRLVQDTAHGDYIVIPQWIMQGYLTMLDECFEQMNGELPTHVFAPCGVGSLAAAVAAQLETHLGEERPHFCVVEPANAACAFNALTTGSPHLLPGELDTIMAGLACGQLSELAWPLLRDYADSAVACDDDVARLGMRRLASPDGADAPVVSGESGAVTTGCLLATLESDARDDWAAKLDITADSKVLLLSTEGDTDSTHYRQIVG